MGMALWHITLPSRQSVIVYSALGQTLYFYGQEFPLNECPGVLCSSKTSWGTVCNGHTDSGQWTGPRLHWHINCLKLLAVQLVLRRFRPFI